MGQVLEREVSLHQAHTLARPHYLPPMALDLVHALPKGQEVTAGLTFDSGGSPAEWRCFGPALARPAGNLNSPPGPPTPTRITVTSP